MNLTLPSKNEQQLIENLAYKFKNKYPHSYNEVEDLIQECCLQVDYIRSKHNTSKSSWNSFLTGCLWNHLNKLCLSTSSPLSLRKQTAKNALKSQSNIFRRDSLPDLCNNKNFDNLFLDLTKQESMLIQKLSFKNRDNKKFKQKHKKILKVIKDKLSD